MRTFLLVVLFLASVVVGNGATSHPHAAKPTTAAASDPVITFYSSTTDCAGSAIASFDFAQNGTCVNFPSMNASGTLTTLSQAQNLYVNSIYLGLDCQTANAFYADATEMGDVCSPSADPESPPNQPWTFAITVNITSPYTLTQYAQSDRCVTEFPQVSGIVPNECLQTNVFWLVVGGGSGDVYFQLLLADSNPQTYNLSFYEDAACTQTDYSYVTGTIGQCSIGTGFEPTFSATIALTQPSAVAAPSHHRYRHQHPAKTLHPRRRHSSQAKRQQSKKLVHVTAHHAHSKQH